MSNINKVTLTKKYENGDKEYIYPKTSSDLISTNNNTLNNDINNIENILSLLDQFDLDKLTLLNNKLSQLTTNKEKTLSKNIEEIVRLIPKLKQMIIDTSINISDIDKPINQWGEAIYEIRKNIAIGFIQDKNHITSVNIPKEITKIKSYAFYGCRNLKSVNIPDSVTNISSYAFCDCTSLEEITLPEYCEGFYIGERAFDYCHSLKKVVIPEGCTGLGSECFDNCYNLKEIILPSTLTALGYWTFSSTAIETIEIPNNMTYIGGVAFASCRQLREIIIDIENSKLEQIAEEAFDGCNSLKIFPFPKALRLLRFEAFTGCGFEEVDFSYLESITLGTYAFSYCRELHTVRLPTYTHFWGDKTSYNSETGQNTPIYNAFLNCPNIEFVYLGDNFNGNHLDLTTSTKYSHDMILEWFNKLKDANSETEQYEIRIGYENLEKMSEEEIAIATTKNWTVS